MPRIILQVATHNTDTRTQEPAGGSCIDVKWCFVLGVILGLWMVGALNDVSYLENSSVACL